MRPHSLRDRFAQIPLAPAELSVVGFVVASLALSIGFRTWNTLATPPPAIPGEYRALDSLFEAKRNAVFLVASTRDSAGLWAPDRGAKKVFPAPHSIPLNTAGPDQLRRLPAVGPALAQRIINFRRSTPFRHVEDLRRVEGIGDRKMERIRPYVTVE